jgi:hypothetical protein
MTTHELACQKGECAQSFSAYFLDAAVRAANERGLRKDALARNHARCSFIGLRA